MIHTVKGFNVVNKADWSNLAAAADVFLEFSCFFYDPMDVRNVISGSSAFSKSKLNIWKCTVHIPLKPGLENFASVWDEFNCAVVLSIPWHYPSLGLERNIPFPVLWPLLSSPNVLAYWVQQFYHLALPFFSSPVATAEFSKCAGMLTAALPQHHLLGFEIAQLEFHHLH